MTAWQIIKTGAMAVRPKTLTASLVPVFVGTALVLRQQHQVIWWISLCAVISATFIQIGTNLFNDAIDFKKGADDEKRLGPQRVTQSGLLSSKQVMALGFASFAIALGLGIPLVVAGGKIILVIGILSLLGGYAYTGGPFPLAYRGWGDFFVVLFFGWVAVGGIYFLHTDHYHLDALVAGTQVGLLCAVLIAINNLRDVIGDSKVSKRTLAVRFGIRFVRWEITLLALLPFALCTYWLVRGWWWVAVVPMLNLPLTYKVLRGVWKTEPSEVYNGFLAQAAALHMLFGLALSFGLALGAGVW